MSETKTVTLTVTVCIEVPADAVVQDLILGEVARIVPRERDGGWKLLDWETTGAQLAPSK